MRLVVRILVVALVAIGLTGLVTMGPSAVALRPASASQGWHLDLDMYFV